MHLDKQRVYDAYREYDRKFRIAEQALSEFAGGINFNSPKQVAELLYDRLGFSELTDRRGNALRTKGDARKTDSETIVQLKANTKHQREFLALLKERNELEAALSKNLRFFMAVVDETEDSLFYAHINQTITQTHRFSSTGKKVKFKAFDKAKGAQIQNIDRDFKPLFSPRHEGWKIGEGDAAQLEFRVAAFLGQDERAIHDILAKVDVHSFTSQTLTDAGQPTDRQNAKKHTFKPLYGGSSGTKAEQTYYEAFKSKYPGIVDAQEEWKTTVEKTKQLTTATGLIFYWPDTKWEGSAKRPYLKNTTSICNFPVQSLATADIVPVALVICWYMMRAKGMKSFVINTIHDSVVAEVAPGEEEEFKECIEYSFTEGVVNYLKVVYNIDFNVPLETETAVKSFWGEK
jgi:DNA polymerase I-like protein with 3'-5' exonuclease and polymerase domains